MVITVKINKKVVYIKIPSAPISMVLYFLKPRISRQTTFYRSKNKYGEDINLEPLDDNLEIKAKEFIIHRESKA